MSKSHILFYCLFIGDEDKVVESSENVKSKELSNVVYLNFLWCIDAKYFLQFYSCCEDHKNFLGETIASHIIITFRCCCRLQHPHFSQIYRYGIYFYNFEGNKNDHTQNEHTTEILRNADVVVSNMLNFSLASKTPTNELYA